jgi:hypothetical protein
MSVPHDMEPVASDVNNNEEDKGEGVCWVEVRQRDQETQCRQPVPC